MVEESEKFGINGLDSLVKILNDSQWTLEESLRVVKLELESLKKENVELKKQKEDAIESLQSLWRSTDDSAMEDSIESIVKYLGGKIE